MIYDGEEARNRQWEINYLILAFIQQGFEIIDAENIALFSPICGAHNLRIPNQALIDTGLDLLK